MGVVEKITVYSGVAILVAAGHLRISHIGDSFLGVSVAIKA